MTIGEPALKTTKLNNIWSNFQCCMGGKKRLIVCYIYDLWQFMNVNQTIVYMIKRLLSLIITK